MDTGVIMEQVKVQIAVANAQELLQVNQWGQASMVVMETAVGFNSDGEEQLYKSCSNVMWSVMVER